MTNFEEIQWNIPATYGFVRNAHTNEFDQATWK